MDFARSPVSSIAVILGAMIALAVVEAAIPLHARGRSGRAHLGPNLALTFLTFATNAALSAGLVLLLVRLESMGVGLLNQISFPPLARVVIVLLVLDFAFYAAHVAMHRIPAFWRFHRVHHSDPAVDVTTTIRQHPGEGLIRYAFTSAFACAIGASPAAFAIYRLAVALSGLLEHANIRAPQKLDTALSLVVTWPHMHKVHHARDAALTDTNYGNLFSWWDRLFGTFTPSRRGTRIAYGLDGFDAAELQTTAGLLRAPWRAVAHSPASPSPPSDDSASSGMPSPDSPDKRPTFA